MRARAREGRALPVDMLPPLTLQGSPGSSLRVPSASHCDADAVMIMLPGHTHTPSTALLPTALAQIPTIHLRAHRNQTACAHPGELVAALHTGRSLDCCMECSAFSQASPKQLPPMVLRPSLSLEASFNHSSLAPSTSTAMAVRVQGWSCCGLVRAPGWQVELYNTHNCMAAYQSHKLQVTIPLHTLAWSRTA